MKISTAILVGLITVITAYFVGQLCGRLALAQADVIDLKSRVKQLESEKIRREERWRWLSWIGSQVLTIKHFFHHH